MKILGASLTVALAVFGFACGDVTPAGGTGGGGHSGSGGSATGGSGNTGGTDGGTDGSPGNDGSGDGMQCGTTCPAGSGPTHPVVVGTTCPAVGGTGPGQRTGRTAYGMTPVSEVEKARTRMSGPLTRSASTTFPPPT